MRAALSAANIILGIAYTSYGLMTFTEMKRDWTTMGWSHFGAAWVAMAFTCGPHHLFHGIHLAFEQRDPSGLDLTAVLIGLPFGIIWLLLRIEAFVGGRGDRFISGTPGWLLAAPIASAVYVTALGAAALQVDAPNGFHLAATIAPNLLLVAIYITIGYFLFRTQLRNHHAVGGWSVSGLSLGVVFPTCALMHGVFILQSATGRYPFDIHGFTAAWFGVPAGMYFLWVVRKLYHDALKDWNRREVGLVDVKEVVWR